MKVVYSEKKAEKAIRANMEKAGCTEEHIQSALTNYRELHNNGVVGIAVL